MMIQQQVEKAEVLSMKNHTTQHLHYDDTFGDCTYSFHISIIVLEIAHKVFDSTAPMTAHTVFHIWRLHIQFSHKHEESHNTAPMAVFTYMKFSA